MKNLTKLQKQVSKEWNKYGDELFIELVTKYDDPEFFQECCVETLSNVECIEVLSRLHKISNYYKKY